MRTEGKIVKETDIEATVVSITGCGVKLPSFMSEKEIEDTTEDEEKEDEEEEKEKKAKKKEKKEEETEEQIEEKTQEDDIETIPFSKAALNWSRTTGYVGAFGDEITNDIERTGITVMEPDQDMIDFSDEDDCVVFHFEMDNEEDALTIEGMEQFYSVPLDYDGYDYYVSFGTAEYSDYSEMQRYCQAGTTVEYWAIGYELYGDYFLLPFIAGNEDNGYYVVRPILANFDIDVSDIMTLEEQDVDYTIYNNLKFPIYMQDEVITINGVECKDVICYIEAQAQDWDSDTFYLSGVKLKKGDVVEFSAMVVNDDTFEEVGTVDYVFTME